MEVQLRSIPISEDFETGRQIIEEAIDTVHAYLDLATCPTIQILQEANRFGVYAANSKSV